MNQTPITLIDYGGSNLRSVQKAFEAVGAAVVVTSDPDEVRRAARLVLPGVGAFGAGMAALRRRGLDAAVIEAAGRGVAVLGICLGMQFLFDESEEMGRHAGLGLIAGRVLPFPAGPASDGHPLKVPHVGWNQITHDGRHPVLAGVASGGHVYFVHSYFCTPRDPAHTLAETEYGVTFTAIAARDTVCGIQFHPEKSQAVGLRLLRNFAAGWEGTA